jgi:hypothetical protein
MRVRVFFHEQASGPGEVVPVSRRVPRSPKMATALNELLGGPTARERAAELEIEGRSSMTSDELIKVLAWWQALSAARPVRSSPGCACGGR